MATIEYNCCVKLSNDNWITYHSVNNLIRFTKFLDKKFGSTPKWLFYNVYDKWEYKTNGATNVILENFTNGDNKKTPWGKTL